MPHRAVDLKAVHDLLPGTEVVLVGANIDDTEVNALVHLAEFNVSYLSVFDPVNELARRFEGIGARTIPMTVCCDPERRGAARVIGITDAHERLQVATVIANGPDYVSGGTSSFSLLRSVVESIPGVRGR